MDRTILEWLLEEENPEVRLRTLKECEKLPEGDERVIDCKRLLLQSKVYERALKKLRTDKPWAKFDAILAFAEWGLTRADIGEDIDGEVFALIERTGFKMLCGEPLLLRNLVKLGYGGEDVVKSEIDSALGQIKDDGGFGCISTNKKINDPRKPHKSCARLTVEYLLLAAELHLLGCGAACEDALAHYFTKRNIFYRTDDMNTPIWERDKERPYYRNKQRDVTAFFDFLKDYADCASRLYDELECDKLKIEVTAQRWSLYEAEMLRFLGIAHRDAPTCQAKDGTYLNAALGASFSIRDGILTDPEGARRRLSPKTPTEFFVEGLPIILCFFGDDAVKLCGQQIIPQWSETGTVYTRKEDQE